MRTQILLLCLILFALKVEARQETLETLTVDNVTQIQQIAEFSPDGSDLIGDLTPDLSEFAKHAAGKDHWQTSVAFSPDGKYLVAGSYDTSVRIWNLDSGDRYLTLIGHLEMVNDVAFSPDGTLVASCSGAYEWYQDFSVRVWDSRTGELLKTLSGHTNQVMDIAFSPDGTRIASAGFDGTVRIWDIRTGDELQIISADNESTYTVSFSPTGDKLLTAGSDGAIKIWNVRTMEIIAEYHHEDRIYDATFNSIGDSVVSTSIDGSVRLWGTTSANHNWIAQIANGEVDEHDFPIHPTDVAMSSSGAIIAVAFGNSIRLLDGSSGSLLYELVGHTDSVDGIAFNSDGTLLASASVDGSVRLWAVPSTKD